MPFRLPQRHRTEVALLCGPNGRGYLVRCWRGRWLGVGMSGADDQQPHQDRRGRDDGVIQTGTSCRGANEICHSARIR